MGKHVSDFVNRLWSMNIVKELLLQLSLSNKLNIPESVAWTPWKKYIWKAGLADLYGGLETFSFLIWI